jgi:hypothetical protein
MIYSIAVQEKISIRNDKRHISYIQKALSSSGIIKMSNFCLSKMAKLARSLIVVKLCPKWHRSASPVF